jgi:hypothetical protein
MDLFLVMEMLCVLFGFPFLLFMPVMPLSQGFAPPSKPRPEAGIASDRGKGFPINCKGKSLSFPFWRDWEQAQEAVHGANLIPEVGWVPPRLATDRAYYTAWSNLCNMFLEKIL